MMVNKICLGTKYEYLFSFSQNDVIAFSEASGDKNPIHLDKLYADKTIFGRTIIHGFLGGSVFSKVFGTIFPGEGTIYLKQNMSFFKPMFIEENYVARFEVIEIISHKNRALIKTTILNNEEVLIISGEALIQHNRFA
jgi:3-hydroxybutyryl-CoA dehydratase